MAIFYRPPEPAQAVPKVLPRTPGSEPPRIGPLGGSSAVLAAVGMWAAAAAVPMPTQKPLKVAALTLTYGSQPPPTPPLSNGNAAATLSSWPSTGEPRLLPVIAAPSSAAWNIPPVNAPKPHTPYPASVWIASPAPLWQPPAPVSVAPLTLAYGQQPPRTVPMQIALSPWWSAPSWPAPPEPETAGWNVPVVSSSYVPPSIQPPSILQAWYQDPIVIVWVGGGAGLPTGGDQPTPQGPITPSELAVLRTWDPAPWPAQSEPENAGWNVTPPVVNNPPPFTPYPFASLLQWGTAWPAQTEADNAGWNFVPPVVNVPPTQGPPSSIIPVLSWQPGPPLPARPVAVAPLTLRYGTQPPPSGPINPATLSAILQQWPALWWPAQAPDPAAPLTLVYGDRPPILGVRVPLAALLAWYPTWAAQFAGPSAAIAAPLIVIPVILIGTLHLEPVFTASLSVAGALDATLAIQPPE